MACYEPKYRAGYEGYVHYGLQGGEAVGICATTDPVALAGPWAPVGLVPLPGLSDTHNRTPLVAIGESREQGSVAGRRDYAYSMRHQIADGRFLAYGIRDRNNLNGAGTRNGLQLLCVDMGVDSRYGAEAFGNQCLDSLINTWSFEAAEGQVLMADTELWCTAIVPSTPQVRLPASTNALIWSQLYMTRGSTDYHALFSRVRLGGTNNLERVGVRHQFGAEGNELYISRTAYYIKPKMEQITLTYQLHDDAPADVLNSADWGTVVLRAEHPVGTPNRMFIEYVIDHEWINRRQRAQAGPNQMISYSLDMAAIAVSVTAGPL